MQNNNRRDQKNKTCKNRPIIPTDGTIVDAPARNEATHDAERCDCYHDYTADACDVSSVSDWSAADSFLPSLGSWILMLVKAKRGMLDGDLLRASLTVQSDCIQKPLLSMYASSLHRQSKSPKAQGDVESVFRTQEI